MYLSFTVLGFSGVILVPPISRNPSTPGKKKKNSAGLVMDNKQICGSKEY